MAVKSYSKINPVLTRRAVLAGGVSVVASAALAEAPLRSQRPQVRPQEARIGGGGPSRPEDRLVARPSLEGLIARADLGGETGVVLCDLETGQTVEGVGAQTAMMPASVTKAVTALYALDALGIDHRFETRLMAGGPVVDGVLNGDLVLVGGHDPVFDTDDLAAMVAELVAGGLREVRGGLRVWAGPAPDLREIDPGQLAHLGYNPGVSGMNLNFNRVHFEWTREGGGYAVTMEARSEAQRPAVRVATMRLSDRPAPVYAYENQDGVDSWSVARGALNNFGSRWLPVRRPAIYAADVLRSLAEAQGITLAAPQMATDLPTGAVLARHQSAPLSQIVRGMLRFSTNSTAEIIGRAATIAKGGDAATLASSAAAMTGWVAQTYGAQVRLVDHSGLGDASRISAASMVRILAGAERGPLRDVLRNIVLVDDTRSALDDPPGVVLAKTGTLNFVSSLAGYYDTNDGRKLAFAIFSGNIERRDAGKLSGDEQPRGSISYNTRAKRMQMQILRHWGRILAVPSPQDEATQPAADPPQSQQTGAGAAAGN